MEFYKVEDGKLLFYAPLSECKNCHDPMVNWYKDVPQDVLHKARQNGIQRESYRESGVCQKCMEQGGFLRDCGTCGKKHEFPKGFTYQTTHYAKYPEDETEYLYICNDCVSGNQAAVIEELACAGDISKVSQAG